MKQTPKLVLVLAALLAVPAYSQSTYNPSTAGAPTGAMTIRDNPGTLGMQYTDLNYTWVNFRERGGVDADGFAAGFRGNAAVRPGFDGGLGYTYYRENGHLNPFTGTEFDTRYHQLRADATFYSPARGAKPFVRPMIGYQWSRGDLQSLRTYDDQWIWGATGGVELPLGAISLTPRVSYSEPIKNSFGTWHYAAEAHTWFSEKIGGYFEIAFHSPRILSRSGPESWTYMAGLRFRR